MIDYIKFKEKPKCVECGETEIDDIIWDNYTQNQINIIYEEIKEYIIWKNNMN